MRDFIYVSVFLQYIILDEYNKIKVPPWLKYNGGICLQKLIYLQKEVAHARNIADHYRRNKETLDQQVKLLSSESLDLDMLDERARTVLNFVGEDEFVILDDE